MSAQLSWLFFRCFSCSVTLCPGFFADVVVVCVGRYWPTEWTSPTARWEASCAAAPDRRCSQASWCVMQISTRPPASTCCTTPLITSSWLPQSWSVLCLTLAPGQNTTFPLDGCSSPHSLSWTLSDAARGDVSKLSRVCYVRSRCQKQYCHDE